MAVTIKRVMLWQTEIRSEPGALSAVLEKGASLIRRVANDAEAAASGEAASR